jgi:polysaccharide pyruvyl transferase WcaK-like protein
MALIGPIIIEPGTFDCLNLGDLAMLQVAIGRLRTIVPSAEIRVFTHDADALEAHCPGALPVDDEARREWYAERFFLGSVHSLLPEGASRRLANAQHDMRRRYPRLMNSAMRFRAHMNRSRWAGLRTFLMVMEHASFVVIAGQHTIADAFYSRARLLLETLETAILNGIPTVMLSQGIGPITNRDLLARARDVLPSVKMIAVREPNVGPPVFRALGVSDERVVVTGDDAVAPAFAASAHARRESLGVSLRVTPVAGVDTTVIALLRRPLGELAHSHGISIVPLPSAYHGIAADEHTLRLLLEGELSAVTGEWGYPTVGSLIDRVGSCRVVIAGAYHVAVFALAQGIPVVAVAKSDYYRSTYAGLESLFGLGCETVVLDDPMLDQHLREAVERAWEHADELRPRLLEAAERQVRWSEAAFARAMATATPVEARPRAG